ncbi:MAG: PqqD family protein, partial [Novosphingobium sp.]
METIHKIGEWFEADVDGEVIMMSTETGKYVSLNKTARFLWKCLDNADNAAALLEQTLGTFDVSAEQASAEIAE